MIDRLLKKIIYHISGYFYRDVKKWLFASHARFSDNSRYLFQDNYNPLNIRKIWIAKDKAEYDLVKSLGYECYRKKSFQAIFHALTAKVYIYTCYVSDIGYEYSNKAICVNLWHGIPLKKIEFDIDQGPLLKNFDDSLRSRIKYPYLYRKHDYVLCPSSYVFEYSFKSAFRLEEQQILKFSYPRSIYLKNLKLNSSIFEFLYVPTWRDGKSHFLDNEYFDLDKINNFCILHNCLFKIKLHPNSNININIDPYSNIILVDNKDDPNASLAMAKCLITDYSSIFFDYLVFNRPILFYVFDEDQYKSESRSMYSVADTIDCGEKVYTLNSLLESMRNILEGNEYFQTKRISTINRFGLNVESTNNKALYDRINEIIC